MARVCQVTGKGPMVGNNVSHANNKTNHVQKPNLQKKRVWVAELGRFITVRMTAKGQRVLDKKGAFKGLKDAGLI